MNFDVYQLRTQDTRLPSYTPEAALFGFLSEAGEVAGVFQKVIRGDYDMDTATAKLKKELGDCLWGIATIAFDNGWDLSDVASDNLQKLAERQAKKTLKGSGDDR